MFKCAKQQQDKKILLHHNHPTTYSSKTDHDTPRRLANVAGTQEPIYGPSAIRSVAQEAEKTPYTELTRNDLQWTVMDSTSVESQIFYLFAEDGRVAFVQVIYSNVA